MLWPQPVEIPVNAAMTGHLSEASSVMSYMLFGGVEDTHRRGILHQCSPRLYGETMAWW